MKNGCDIEWTVSEHTEHNISFVDIVTRKKINIEDASVPVKSEEMDCDDKYTVMTVKSKNATFTYEFPYINRKKLHKILYGTTNNYRRLHGGHALREVSTRRYIMKNRR